MNSSNNSSLSVDMFESVRLFIKQVNTEQRKRLRARRQHQLLDSFLQEGTTVPALEQLKNKLCHQQSQRDDEVITQVAKRLRSSYQEDIEQASEAIHQTKRSARHFYLEVLPDESRGEGQKAIGIFDAYCRAAENKESMKPRIFRKRKTRAE